MEELKQQLVALINENHSRLSAEAIYYVVKDFYRDIADAYEDYLTRKIEAEKKQTPQEQTEEE